MFRNLTTRRHSHSCSNPQYKKGWQPPSPTAGRDYDTALFQRLIKSDINLATSLAGTLVLVGILGALAADAQAVTITTVPVGNPGNGNDPVTGIGSVAYNYNIGKYDVTVGQYTDFLNSVAAIDTYHLYNSAMATNLHVAGIARSVASGRSIYSVIGSANHPITYVSWGDAARFANWLNNGQPAGTEGPGTTETGAYTLNGAVTDAALIAVTRNAGAKWFIPTENEYYKAAYYDPAAGHYWPYPNGSNTIISAPPGSTPYTANFVGDTTGYAVTGSESLSDTQNYLTDVGAYTASASPYGTYDQGGNVRQWNETFFGGLSNNGVPVGGRVVRGGSWKYYNTWNAAGDGYDGNIPSYEDSGVGFRLATVPESSGLLGDYNHNGVVDAADYSVCATRSGRRRIWLRMATVTARSTSATMTFGKQTSDARPAAVWGRCRRARAVQLDPCFAWSLSTVAKSLRFSLTRLNPAN